MNKPFHYLAIALFALVSCKKENPVIHADNTAKNTSLTTNAVCKTPPTLMGIRFAGGTLDDNAWKIATDATGNVTLFGDFYGTVDFNPGTGVANLTPPEGRSGVFGQRFNAAGSFLDATYYDSSFRTTFGPHDSNGNRYALGFEGDTGPQGTNPVKAYAYRYDPSGNLAGKMFLGSFTAPYSMLMDIDVDVNNNVIINMNGTWYKGTKDGKLIWKKTLDSGPCTFVLDKHGYIYASVTLAVIKYDNDGNKIWQKSVPGGTSDMAFDAANNIYLTGVFQGEKDFDPGEGTYYITGVTKSDAGGLIFEAFVEKLDATGNFVWAAKPGYCTPLDIALDPKEENIYLAGKVRSASTFSPITGTVNYTSKGNNDAFILAYRQCK